MMRLNMDKQCTHIVPTRLGGKVDTSPPRRAQRKSEEVLRRPTVQLCGACFVHIHSVMLYIFTAYPKGNSAVRFLLNSLFDWLT